MATTSESQQGPDEANGSNGNGIAATAAAVGPEADLFARQDPLALVPTMKKLGAALAANRAGSCHPLSSAAGRTASAGRRHAGEPGRSFAWPDRPIRQ